LKKKTRQREEGERGSNDAFEVEQEGAVVDVDESRFDHHGNGGGGHINRATAVAVRALEVLQNPLGDREVPFRPGYEEKKEKEKKLSKPQVNLNPPPRRPCLFSLQISLLFFFFIKKLNYSLFFFLQMRLQEVLFNLTT